MLKLTRASLVSLPAYAAERSALTSRVGVHRKLRRVPLGEHISLQFEDELTARWQLQEALQLGHVAQATAVQRVLDAANLLISDASNLKATLFVDRASLTQRSIDPAGLEGIEQHIYAEVEGRGRSVAIVNPHPLCHWDPGAHATPLLLFEFSAEQITVLQAGAEFGFGIADDRMRVAHTVKRGSRAALLADFG